MDTATASPRLADSVSADAKPSILIVGAYDLDGRIELMKELGGRFQMAAAGNVPHFRAAFEDAGFRYDHYPLSRRLNPAADVMTLAALVRLFRSRRPDVVHAFATKPSVFARLAARITGVPVVIGAIPGLGSLYTNNDVTTRTVRGCYETIQRLASYVSDLTIFQIKEDARQFLDAGVVSEDKAIVIPGSGVRTNLFDPARFSQSDRQRVRAELGIRADVTLIVMVSRLLRSKGLLQFAGAAETIRKRCPSVAFLLVGADDEESMDQLRREELSQVAQKVNWVGVRNDIPAVLAASDIFALPSYYREGIPRVLIEAASMGLPIVTTDSPGCNDVVVHGVNGLLVPPRDQDGLAHAILRLVEEPELRRRFGVASRQRAVDRFDLVSIAGQIGAIYADLLASKGLLPSEAR